MRGGTSGARQLFRTQITNVDHGSLSPATTEWLGVTVPGVVASAIVFGLSPIANLPAGVGLAGARVSAANTVQIGLINVTADAIVLDDVTWDLVVFVPENL